MHDLEQLFCCRDEHVHWLPVKDFSGSLILGANLFALEPGQTCPLQIKYQEEFTNLFGFATLPFYWGQYEPEPGKETVERLEGMVEWGLANGLLLKGHPLVWHEVLPKWAPKDPPEVEALLEARVKRILSRFGSRVKVWDVLNEAPASTKFAGNGVSGWIESVGQAEAVRRALGWAREATQGIECTLLYNDYNNSDEAFQILSELGASGDLPDAVGLQSHMHGGDWALEEVEAICDRFSIFNLPLHFTEITVLSGQHHEWWKSGPLVPWQTTEKGEARQADYVERLLNLLVRHRAVEAATWWDFCDHKAWLGAPSGLLRSDGSRKPAYEVLAKVNQH